jgi:hypothetical protein
MSDEETARRHDAENREHYAIRREERHLEAVERVLERELKAFEADERAAIARIEAEWRREHHGLDPERRPAWRRNER